MNTTNANVANVQADATKAIADSGTALATAGTANTTAAAANTTAVAAQSGVDALTSGRAGLVQQATPTGDITVAAGTGGTSVNLNNSEGAARRLTGIADGT
ncbi:hypothetical protein, partial [Pseudomonas aeruginosa]|uniref:hypothetical protein n=1 Tax=Pseudomonas aeruginosa TaxID=287 RepID=UPI00396AA3D3